ncbi:PCRF domain-containing protein, partial [bacterium]|nr:PCRF domain-containing protein [bacterium]
MTPGKSSAPRWTPYGGIFKVEEHRQKAKELDAKSQDEDFWDDQERAQKILKDASQHRKIFEDYDALKQEAEDFEVYLELMEEEEDAAEETEKALKKLEKRVESMELRTMLSGPDDAKAAILSIKPGAGGTESQDWANMLYRMYVRYLERQEFDFKVINLQPGDEAGIK